MLAAPTVGPDGEGKGLLPSAQSAEIVGGDGRQDARTSDRMDVAQKVHKAAIDVVVVSAKLHFAHNAYSG